MMAAVRIYHNIEVDGFDRPVGILDGYQPGHKLELVFEYESAVAPSREDLIEIAEEAFHLFNVGTGEVALSYRAKSLRSLSVGDVVAVGEAFLACASSSWTPVDVRPGQVKESV